MIGQLYGKLIVKQPPMLLIDVRGIGYELEAPMTTFYSLPEIGQEICLFTHMVVRDDAHLLFGFATENERRLFRTLLKVNGVGARMALAILSGIEANDFAQCIKDSDTARLTRLPGVGKKTAERLIIEMRDRIEDWEVVNRNDTTTPTSSGKRNAVEDAISALIGLGYKPQEASRFVHAVAEDEMDSESLIREALKASVKT